MFNHERTISLTSTVSPDFALSVIQDAVEGRGYEWEQLTPTSAHVQEGKRRILFRRASIRLAVTVAVHRDTVTVTRETSGFGLMGTPIGVVGVSRTRRHFRRIVRQIRAALGAAQLA
jgi:hypothetical protein